MQALSLLAAALPQKSIRITGMAGRIPRGIFGHQIATNMAATIGMCNAEMTRATSMYTQMENGGGKGKAPKHPPQKPQPNASSAPSSLHNNHKIVVPMPMPAPAIETIPAVKPEVARNGIPGWGAAVAVIGFGAAMICLFGPRRRSGSRVCINHQEE